MASKLIYDRFRDFEKRLLLLVAAVIFIVAIIFRGQAEGFGRENIMPAPLASKGAAFAAAAGKIKPGSSWKPIGYGSGRYLATIPKIIAGAVVDLDSGEVVWSMNLMGRIAPASLTKVAVVMTAIDVAGLEAELKVSRRAASQIPTKLGLKEGEKLKLEEAIAAAILTSANDATEAISDSLGLEVGLGTSTFMELVNKKLQAIGTVSSNFETSTGLDSDFHYSTVYDLAIIGHEALTNYPYISEVASVTYKKLPASSDHRLFDLPNWNALLGTYPGVNGLKIGFTERSGHSTMVSAERNGKKMLAIVIGARSLEEREIAAATLLNYGFSEKGIRAYPIASLDLVGRFEDWRRQLSQGGP